MTTIMPVDQSTDAMTSPYRGLTPYTEADAAYFYGRMPEIAAVAANLEVARLTIFYGPSGVGKSSVLRAGVIHQLRQRARLNVEHGGVAEIIPIYFNRWQSEPMAGLVQAVEEGVAAPGVTRASEEQGEQLALWAPSAAIADFSAYLAEQSRRTQSDLLLILDQFEEYFLYHPDETGPGSFAHALVTAMTVPNLRANFLLSLREDALARLDRFKGQIPFLLDNRLSIGHLTRSAGEEAVRKPLEQYNKEHNAAISIEPALVNAVLEQVGSGKVALSRQGAGVRGGVQTQEQREKIEAPYLQLVMTRLWGQEQAVHSTNLRMATLDSLGGAETIVRNYLDDTLAALDAADQALAAAFFDRLVTPSGTKIALSLEELAHYAGSSPAAVEGLLNRLQDRRLLRGVQSASGVAQYEIFHDVLGQAILDWQTRYRQLQEETKRLAAEQAGRAEAERNAEMERLRAEIQRRDNRRLRGLLALVGLLLVGAIGLTVVAFGAQNSANAQRAVAENAKLEAEAQRAEAEIQKNEAERQSQVARSRQLAAHSLILQQQDPTLSLLLSQESFRVNNNLESRMSILSSLRNVSEQQIPPGNSPAILTLSSVGYVFSLAFGADDKTFISNAKGETRIWDLENPGTSVEIKPTELDPRGIFWSMAISADRARLVTAADAHLYLWDLSDSLKPGLLSVVPSQHPSNIWAMEIRSDGNVLGTYGGGKLTLWDISPSKKSIESIVSIETGLDDIGVLAFSPDGQLLAASGPDQTIIVWDITTLTSPKQIGALLIGDPGSNDVVGALQFSRNGEMLVSGDRKGNIVLWLVARILSATAANIAQFTQHGVVKNIAFSPDNSTMAIGSSTENGPEITLWDISNLSSILSMNVPLNTSSLDLYGLAYSNSGQMLAMGSGAGEITIWDMSVQSWQEESCKLAQRNLTQSEWQRYLGDEPYHKTCQEFRDGE